MAAAAAPRDSEFRVAEVVRLKLCNGRETEDVRSHAWASRTRLLAPVITRHRRAQTRAMASGMLPAPIVIKRAAPSTKCRVGKFVAALLILVAGAALVICAPKHSLHDHRGDADKHEHRNRDDADKKQRMQSKKHKWNVLRFRRTSSSFDVFLYDMIKIPGPMGHRMCGAIPTQCEDCGAWWRIVACACKSEQAIEETPAQ